MPKSRGNLAGQTYGKLTVEEFSHKDKWGVKFWRCRCTCGGTKTERVDRLSSSSHCGCDTKRRLNLVGQKFGNLLVTKFVGFDKRGGAIWECICRCGKGLEPQLVYSVTALLRKGVSTGCPLCRGDRWVSSAGTHGNAQKEHLQPTRFRLWRSIKNRANRNGVPFSITPEDIVVPEVCPLLNVPLICGKGKPGPNNPSLDKIRPELGYVPGNVWVVSKRANWIKNDASLEELKLLTKNLEAKIKEGLNV